MTDLSGYDTRSLGARLRRLRLAAAFAERQAIIEAEESAVFAFRAAGALHPAPPVSPAPPSAAAVSQSALPYTGAAPLSRAQESTLAEEEWAMQKPAAAGGGGGRREPSSPASSGPLARAAPGLGGGAAAPSAGVAPRSAELKKLGTAFPWIDLYHATSLILYVQVWTTGSRLMSSIAAMIRSFSSFLDATRI